MKNDDFVKRLRKTLPIWLGWGAACGSISWVCALVFDVSGGLAGWAAMSLGVLTWSMACGAFAATDWYDDNVVCTRWSDALRLALKVRAGVTVIGAALMVLGTGVQVFAVFNFFILPDFWAGMISVNVGQGLSRLLGVANEAGQSAFGVIYLTTLVQGAWVVASIAGLAGLVFVFRKLSSPRIITSGG